MKNIEWNEDRLLVELKETKNRFYDVMSISDGIKDDVFSKTIKIFREEFIDGNLKRGYDYIEKDLFQFIDYIAKDGGNILPTLKAMYESRSWSESYGLLKKWNIDYCVWSNMYAFMLTDKFLDEIVGKEEFFSFFKLSLNKHLTIKQAQVLVNRFSIREPRSKSLKDSYRRCVYSPLNSNIQNELYTRDLLFLVILYARFYNQKETHKEFYEILSSELNKILIECEILRNSEELK